MNPLADPFFGIRHQGALLRSQLRGAIGEARASAMSMGPRPGSPNFGSGFAKGIEASAGGLKGLGSHHKANR